MIIRILIILNKKDYPIRNQIPLFFDKNSYKLLGLNSNQNLKCQPKKPPPSPELSRRMLPRDLKRESNLMVSTFTKFWNKFTLKSESPRKLWASWTLSSTTLLIDSPWNVPNWSEWTKNTLSLPEKFKPPLSSSSPVNSPNTPYLKEPKPWPNSLDTDWPLFKFEFTLFF